jgi:hypothetical protein
MQHYLITNIGNVTLTGGIPDVYGSTNIHLHASAIFLTRDNNSPRREAPCRIRVFGPDAAWPVTELAAETLDHEISPIPCIVPGAIQISYELRVDRWSLKLVTESQDGAPPEVTAYPDGTPFGDLHAKVAKHWSAPNMPMLKWMPADYVRQMLKAGKES